jgi:hypothetical protein
MLVIIIVIKSIILMECYYELPILSILCSIPQKTLHDVPCESWLVFAVPGSLHPSFVFLVNVFFSYLAHWEFA